MVAAVKWSMHGTGSNGNIMNSAASMAPTAVVLLTALALRIATTLETNRQVVNDTTPTAIALMLTIFAIRVAKTLETIASILASVAIPVVMMVAGSAGSNGNGGTTNVVVQYYQL